jgi:BirA family transcriptional regulator, biotin operon repressor / biotin---[acetyl-CoA-carboxylase] ligase
MASDQLRSAVAALPRGWCGSYFDAVDSTQEVARGAARVGAPSRSVFVADYQRAGRGRQGRSWIAEPGSALMLSLLFRDTATPPVPLRWTTLASVALAQAIEAMLPQLRPTIKWPNDVLLDERKVAGILAENSWDGSARGLVAVVGVGINVRTPASALASIGAPATSLCESADADVDRGDLLLAFIRCMDHWLDQPAENLHAAWESRLWGRGQRLRLREGVHEEEVVVLGADMDGCLRLRLADGTETRTATGELIL